MRRRLLPLLIVCVTMLAQIGAPLAGVASTGSGSVAIGVWCKAQAMLSKRWTGARIEPSAVKNNFATKDISSKDISPEELPDSHRDHASCGFCEASAHVTPVGWVALKPRIIEIYRKLSFDLSSEASPAFAPNRNAPARGPPAFI